jgi:hypothetical protein
LGFGGKKLPSNKVVRWVECSKYVLYACSWRQGESKENVCLVFIPILAYELRDFLVLSLAGKLFLSVAAATLDLHISERKEYAFL